MIITPKIQRTGVLLSLGRRSAPLAMVLACGSIFLACSGTIDTPTDEYPTRSASASATDDDDDAPPARNNSQTASTTPRAPAAPAANDDDEDPPAQPSANDDEDPPAADDAEDPPADDPPAAGGGATLSFESDVYPIFTASCAPCHTGTGLGGINIGDPDLATAFDDASRVADNVVARIEAGGMPPACNGGAPGDDGCIAADDFDVVKAWVEAGAPE